MKKFNLLLIVSAALMMILVACGSMDEPESNSDAERAESSKTAELEYEPEDVNPDTDVCEVCAMAVADDQHATQIVLKNERSLKFDDLGCLYGWIEENSEDEIGAKFVRDFNTEEWTLLEEASFVFDEEIETPMAYGMISFKNQADAESYIDENGLGELLSADDLENHKWEMMDHSHDDHDGHNHDEHGHHDHGHGFHTEGFDMHLTELESVTAAEETKLEVKLTLDDSPLEAAMVRYEIWKENDKDHTEWIDAEEAAAGNYVADHTFKESGTYHMQIHVEDEDGLHEHMESEVSIKE